MGGDGLRRLVAAVQVLLGEEEEIPPLAEEHVNLVLIGLGLQKGLTPRGPWFRLRVVWLEAHKIIDRLLGPDPMPHD